MKDEKESFDCVIESNIILSFISSYTIDASPVKLNPSAPEADQLLL